MIAVLYDKECFCGLSVSIVTVKAREKNVEALRQFVRYIDITQHLLVYRHVIFTSCCSSITLLYTQNGKSFCPVRLINLLKVWNNAVYCYYDCFNFDIELV